MLKGLIGYTMGNKIQFDGWWEEKYGATWLRAQFIEGHRLGEDCWIPPDKLWQALGCYANEIRYAMTALEEGE